MDEKGLILPNRPVKKLNDWGKGFVGTPQYIAGNPTRYFG